MTKDADINREGLEVEVEKKQEGTFLVVPNGRIDSDTYTILEDKLEAIVEPSTKVIIFDMGKVLYISSAGLGVIFSVKKSLKANNGSLIVTNLQPQIKKVFKIVNALPEDTIFSSMEEVDTYLDAIQKREMDKLKGSE